MFKTIREFWLRWRLQVAEQRVYINTERRRHLIARHERQVKKVERLRAKLADL